MFLTLAAIAKQAHQIPVPQAAEDEDLRGKLRETPRGLRGYPLHRDAFAGSGVYSSVDTAAASLPQQLPAAEPVGSFAKVPV